MPIFPDQGMRMPSSRALRIRGLIGAAVLSIAGTALYQLGTEGYSDAFTVIVVADTIGEGLTPGAEVKFRGLTIGSVQTLQSVGYNKQKLTMVLEARQARALATDTTAQFTSSNTFGTAAVELVSSGKGSRLEPNQTLVIGSDARSTSITGLLRQGQKLGQIVDSPDIDHIIGIVRRHADLTEPVATSFFDLARMLADSQRVPFSQSLSVVASVVNGANDSIPLIGLASQFLDGMAFLVQPGGTERTNMVLDQLSKLMYDGGQILVNNLSWFVPLVDSAMSIAAPITSALGSLAPAYDRLSGLLDRTSTAFPLIDGKVRMQVEVIMDTMPGIAAALPTGPAAPAAGGGR